MLSTKIGNMMYPIELMQPTHHKSQYSPWRNQIYPRPTIDKIQQARPSLVWGKSTLKEINFFSPFAVDLSISYCWYSILLSDPFPLTIIAPNSLALPTKLYLLSNLYQMLYGSYMKHSPLSFWRRDLLSSCNWRISRMSFKLYGLEYIPPTSSSILSPHNYLRTLFSVKRKKIEQNKAIFSFPPKLVLIRMTLAPTRINLLNIEDVVKWDFFISNPKFLPVCVMVRFNYLYF